MNLRQLRRRHNARTVRVARLSAYYESPGWFIDEDDDDPWPDPKCLHCGGDGMDPDVDYLLPCPECG